MIGYGASRIHRAVRARRGRALADDDARSVTKTWVVLAILVLFTHVLNDFSTVYGTQLFTPFSDRQFGLPAVPVIDPVYTLIMLAGLFIAWRRGWSRPQARGMTLGALVLSTGYLLLALAQNERARDLVLRRSRRAGTHRHRLRGDDDHVLALAAPDRDARAPKACMSVMYRPSTRAPSTGPASRASHGPKRWPMPRSPPRKAPIYRRFARGIIHPHIVEGAQGDLFLRLGDIALRLAGRGFCAGCGAWNGRSWKIADGLAIAGEGLRFMQRSAANAHVVRALLQAKAGQDNDIF